MLQTIEFDLYFTSDSYQLMLSNKPSDYIRAIEDDPSLLQVTDSNGTTIFHVAAMYGRLQVMDAINNIDAYMKDQVDKYNATPLIFASSNGRAASVKWLLDHDADVNIKTIYGETALDRAWNQNIKDMIKEK